MTIWFEHGRWSPFSWVETLVPLSQAMWAEYTTVPLRTHPKRQPPHRAWDGSAKHLTSLVSDTRQSSSLAIMCLDLVFWREKRTKETESSCPSPPPPGTSSSECTSALSIHTANYQPAIDPSAMILWQVLQQLAPKRTNTLWDTHGYTHIAGSQT